MNNPITIKINSLQSSKLISSFSSGKELNLSIKLKLFNIVFQAHIKLLRYPWMDYTKVNYGKKTNKDISKD